MTYDFDEVANSVAAQGAVPLIIKVLEMHKGNVGVAEQALAALCQLVSTHGAPGAVCSTRHLHTLPILATAVLVQRT